MTGETRSLFGDVPLQLGHIIERVKVKVLIVRQNEDEIRTRGCVRKRSQKKKKPREYHLAYQTSPRWEHGVQRLL